MQWSDLYAETGPIWTSIKVDDTNVVEDPGFAAYSLNGDLSDDDLHLRPSSALVDAGDPSICSSTDNSGCDPDGTRPDIGLYGGTGAGSSAFEDGDGDGLYDAWEAANGLDPVTDDSADDLDGDGLTNLEEYSAGTSPQSADSDGDGVADAAELSAGSDPSEASSLPVPLRVPEHLPTIQAAIDAILEAGAIEVSPGRYQEALRIEGKSIILRGSAGPEQTILDGRGTEQVLQVKASTLELSGFTLENGMQQDDHAGGTMYLGHSLATLENLVFQSGWALGGGAFAAYDSVVTLRDALVQTHTGGAAAWSYQSRLELKDVRFLNNKATYDEGGAVYAEASELRVQGCTFEGNSASSGGAMWINSSTLELEDSLMSGNATHMSGDGGALYVMGSEVDIHRTRILANSAEQGGGIFIVGSSGVVSNVMLSDNVATLWGGGMAFYGAAPTLRNVTVSSNAAPSGGGAYLKRSDPAFANVVFSENEAADGGGLYLQESNPVFAGLRMTANVASRSGGGMSLSLSDPTIMGAVIVDNLSADAGGGMVLRDGSGPLLVNSVLSSNSPYNLFTYDGLPEFIHCDLFVPAGGTGINLWAIDESNLEVDPRFLVDGDGLTPDYHLAAGSPLIDAGFSELMDADGSPSDIGAYGGSSGNGWDLDGDGVPDYYWPGTWEDVPEGIDPAGYDCDDTDAGVQACP